MQRALLVLKIAACGLLCCFIGAATVTVLDVDETLVLNAPNFATRTNNLLDKSTLAVDQYEKAGHDLRLTLDNVNKAAIDERMFYEQQIPGYSKQLTKLLDTTNASVASTQQVTNGATLFLAAATERVDAFAPIQQHLDATISDPAIHTTLLNVQVASEQGALAAAQVRATTQQANQLMTNINQQTVEVEHGWLYRVWKKVF